MQLFVRTLHSGTVPVQLAQGDGLAELQSTIQCVCGVPAQKQRLRCGLRDVRDDGDVAALTSGATVSLLLRLVGGKGGFGSLLRVQGRDTKATTNFEACRDLSGRRLRHVNAEKKMEEWTQGAQERELEKIALKHVTECARQQRREKRKAMDPQVVTHMQKETVHNVKKAVQSALKAAQSMPDQRSKKPRFAYHDDDESESEEEELSEESSASASHSDVHSSRSLSDEEGHEVRCCAMGTDI